MKTVNNLIECFTCTGTSIIHIGAGINSIAVGVVTHFELIKFACDAR